MLISLKFKNFLSYKDETQLLMTSVKAFKELKETNVFKARKFELLKTAVVYGPNGGGKSNLIKAMGFMTHVIHNSFADSLKKKEDQFDYDLQFILNSESENLPIEMEAVFIKNDIIYRYGFHIKNNVIEKEWLFHKKDVETKLFEREFNNFSINNNTFTEGSKYKNNINENVLFLSYLAQNNTKIASEVFGWFYNVNVINALNNDNLIKATKALFKSSKFKIWLSYAVKFLAISNVDIDQENNIMTYHNKFDENDFIVDTIPFDLDTVESEGTIKLVYLLGAIYDSLKIGKVLFIDEFDAKLHTNLTKKLLQLFHKFNVKNSQFVFTMLDTDLMDKEIFRRDQIWFVDKNKFGASELYSLSDFDSSVVRSTSDFKKKYLDLTFGAAESINISQNLVDLLYD
jgi:AAA15 family ATPase/GTPase